MNENIDLTKILKDCPQGTKLYSSIFGKVEFQYIKLDSDSVYPIVIKLKNGFTESIAPNGNIFNYYDGECTLFPSKEQKDWSKFTAPWYKKEKFDPKTLNPFDRVLVRNYKTTKWRCDHFSHFDGGNYNPCIASCCSYTFCIPYNDDTKHLLGTTDEAPEYYRYWEGIKYDKYKNI